MHETHGQDRKEMRINLIVCMAMGFATLMSAYAGNGANPDAVELTPLPMPVAFSCDMDSPVTFDASASVTVACPDAEAVVWLGRHFAEWYGDQAPKVVVGASSEALPDGNEAYAVSADASGIRITANSLTGVRWAAYTLRCLAIARRGTFKTEGRILPVLKVSDRPHLAFRAIHLCWFPEVRPVQMERAIRLAALLKFNYAIIEPWGMYASEKHPRSTSMATPHPPAAAQSSMRCWISIRSMNRFSSREAGTGASPILRRNVFCAN